MTCAEIKDRTVDYLYGELPEGERAAFDQHLAGCASCQAEVAALQGTLQQARAAVKLTDEPPPARVRVAVMEAARAAAASVPMAARAAAARPEPKARTEGGGFWSWLRGPWLMPLAGAAAAVAIFVLARDVILRQSGPAEIRQEREKHAGPAPSVVSPVAAPPPAQAPPPPAEERAAPAARPEAKPKGHRADDGDSLEGRGPRPATTANKASRQPSADRRYAPPPPARRALMDSPVEGLDGLASGAAAPRDEGRAQKESQDKQGVQSVRTRSSGPGVGQLGGEARAATGAGAGEKKQVSREAGDLAKTAPAKAEASPPAPAAAAAPPPPPRPARAPAPRAAEPEPAPAPAMAESVMAEEEAAEKPVTRYKAKKDARSPFDLQVEKADKLFTSGRWAEAAEAYRALLRQYPQHRSAVGWKGRLRACEQALSR